MRFCGAIGQETLANDPRFKTNVERVRHVDELDRVINQALKTDTVATWVERLDAVGVPAGPVLSISEVLSHPQLEARNMLPKMEHPRAGTIQMTGIVHHLEGTPGTVRLPLQNLVNTHAKFSKNSAIHSLKSMASMPIKS